MNLKYKLLQKKTAGFLFKKVVMSVKIYTCNL